MTVINDTWRFLVQRKLWPVAILLVAAAAAIPVLLSEEPAAPAAPAVAAVKSDEDASLTTQPIVALADEGDRAERRRVLGSPKDPSKPNATPTPTPAPESASVPTAPAGGGLADVKAGGTGPSVGGGPATPGSPGGAPVSPGFAAPLTPVTPKKKYELFELTVRFGASEDGVQPRQDFKRLEALPSSDEPVLIYLGVLKDRKTAVFMVESGVIAQGDGTCRPSRAVCDTVHLKEGETEFFDIPGETADGGSAAQYQLDVIKIRKKTTSSAKQAKRATARVSKAGRKILRARIAGDGPLRYRFDKRSGRLEKLTRKAYKAVVAKAARTARARF